MARSRRSLTEIRMEMLREAAKEPIRPTRLMYKVNVSWAPLQRELENLIAMGWLETVKVDGDRRSVFEYRTTSKGIEILRKWKELEVDLKF